MLAVRSCIPPVASFVHPLRPPMFRFLREICQPSYVDARANQDVRTRRTAFADRVRAPVPFKTVRESSVRAARLAWIYATHAAFYLEFIGFPTHVRTTAIPRWSNEAGAPEDPTPVEAVVPIDAENRSAPVVITGLTPNTDYQFSWTTIYFGGTGFGALPTTIKGANPDREYISVLRRNLASHGPPRNVEPQPSVRLVQFAAAKSNIREQVTYRLVLVDASDEETRFQFNDFTPTTVVTVPANRAYIGTLSALYSTGDEHDAPSFEYVL